MQQRGGLRSAFKPELAALAALLPRGSGPWRTGVAREERRKDMFRRTVQRVVVGMALAMLLMLTVPAPAEAAGFDPARAEDLWAAVWDWLAGLWGGPETGPSLRSEAAESGTSCGGDAGVCVDPNGANTPTTCQGDAGACVDPNGG